ncbi:GMC family oxidoreductase N-terminal domain-containing protein [Desulfobacter sp.]|uniref:GMC family oxidoreductase N-terminal domain-containing protein n=1 Tax=Desulfobacter sp. TaxID=2294 RepID=UPI003D130817
METDVVVVGSGPGGATVARELSLKGRKVTIMEWGKDNAPDGKIVSDPFRFFGGIAHKKRGFLETSSEPVMTMLRCITTGGSSMAYGGVSWDPPKNTFHKYGINLGDAVNSIKKEIIIKPLTDEQMGPAAKLISKSARELGIKWNKIDRFFKDPTKFKHEAYLFGDKTGARWDARSWILDAIDNGGTLMNETFCEKVIIENGRATGVVAMDKKNRRITVSADTVVIAAGGVGSPAILIKSGINEAGKNFFNEPYVIAIGYVDRELSGKEVSRQEGVLFDGQFSLGDMAIPAQVYQQIVLTQSKAIKIIKRTRALSIVVEIVDDLNGSVDADGKVHKPLSKRDFEKLEKGKAMARKILENAGAKDIWFTKISGVHPGGTCKIGDVVDSNLKTRIDNLYVADASVLPESFAIPPLLTILALAKRLADYLS